MFDQESNIREALRKKRSRIEQIERILSGTTCDLGGRYSLRLIEEKQYLETVVAELERTLRLLLQPVVVAKESAVPVMDRGSFCREVKGEIRSVKNLCVQSGLSVAEIRKAYPDWNVWNLLDGLTSEDRDMFHRPRQWGPVVGYSLNLLSKYYRKSPATIRDWCKRRRPGKSGRNS